MEPSVYCPKSGAAVHLVHPDPRTIHLSDIASHLSNLCRYTGGVRLSVAQHSIYVASLLPARLRLEGMLHDAPEYVLGEVAAPLKQLLAEYRTLEHSMESVMRKLFNLSTDPADWALVKHADLDCRQDEMYWLCPEHPRRDRSWVPRNKVTVLGRRYVEQLFYEMTAHLCQRRGVAVP
jgi:uncharacterized protein